MTNNKIQPCPKGFILVDLVDRGNIVENPLTSNKAWLTLFYALPEELVSKAKAYLDFPRCPYEVLRTEKYDKLINEEPVTEDDLYDVFLGCIHAFVRRVNVTPKSKASKKQYMLYYLNVNIPQPPPRIIRRHAYTYVIHFIPKSPLSIKENVLSLSADSLVFH